MLDDPEKRWVGNLYSTGNNSGASQAMLRRPVNKDGVTRPQFLGTGNSNLANDKRFETIMAANQNENRIIAEVLDGPVSQQTQRQLAQMQTLNQASTPLDDFTQSQILNAEETPAPRARVRALKPGSTIVVGKGTGSVFNPAQMAAYRQKHGIQITMPERSLEGTTTVEESRALKRDTSKPIQLPANISSDSKEANESLEILLGPKVEDIRHQDIDSIIKRVGEALDLDPALIKAVVKTESNYNPNAVSHAGAKGLMQLMPRTAKEMGVQDPFDPLQNIWGGAKYLKRMLERQGGNLNKALAAYNWGPGNLARNGYGNNMPQETRRYIEVVNRNYKKYQKQSLEA
ncbi:MAG: lytic transglycosylase domain-containing protein [Deltaproteobacteria bacterium]|jgi:hypothetical protein|nr:lytic transglycosylase domain-containing protein [Deltaproteobacteria bacterium]